MAGERYTQEFKIAAVQQIIQEGHSIPDVARRLGITTKSLYNWRARHGNSGWGDIAFAFDQNGERQIVDAQGNLVTEYEAGAPSKGVVSFAFGDQSQLIHHLQMMGMMDNALAVIEMAE
jgi:hypothetical protein